MADFRFVFRVLTRAPGFTLTAVLALALGIGATTAIFSLVNGVLLRPLPYAEPDRLVMVWQDFTGRGGPIDEWASPGVLRDWRDDSSFSSVAGVTGWRTSASFDGTVPDALMGEQVTHDYFATLGLTPAVGRWFTPEEDLPGAPRAVVLSHDLWQTRFGGDRAIVGRAVTIGNEPHEVVGVAPPGTRGVVVADAAMWRPLRLDLASPPYDSIFLRAVGRLAPGVEREQAQAALATTATVLAATELELRDASVFVQPAQTWIVGDARLPLLVLMAAVLTLLTLTVANIANLMLARTSAREREFSVRAAIGASRSRLVRLMVIESLTLAAAGGIAGMLVGAWALSGLLVLMSDTLPRAAEVSLDGRVLLFAVLVSSVAGLLCGLVPAMQSSRPDLQTSLRDSGRSTSRKGHLARKGLVVAQVALALVMLATAGLIVRSFAGLREADLGFDVDNVAVGTVSLAGAGYREGSRVISFMRDIEERLPALPGAAGAAFTSVLPLSPAGDSDVTFAIKGRPAVLPDGRERVSWYRSVSSNYFDVIGMRFTAGRTMTPGAAEAVVNETFARRFFETRDASAVLGERLIGGPHELTIVGVVADVRTRGPRSDVRTEMFLPYDRVPEASYTLVVRARDGFAATGLIPEMRRLVASIDNAVPVATPTTLNALRADALAQPRLLATLLASFATAALLLALLGLYGVIAFGVGQRTNEMGIRLALGATPAGIVRMVIGDGLRLGAVGLVLGTIGTLAVSGVLGSLLYGVEPRDPLTLACAAGAITIVAVIGSWLPARRAAKTAPTSALRA